MEFSVKKRAVPASSFQHGIPPPHQEKAQCVNNRYQTNLRASRITETHRGRDGLMKFFTRAFRDQPSFKELIHHRPHSLVNHEFGQNQQGHSNEEANVTLDVLQEWQFGGTSPGVPFQNGKKQEREPGDSANDQDTAAKKFQNLP